MPPVFAFAGRTLKTAFAETAIMAAITQALVLDSVSSGTGTTTTAATILAQASPTFPSTTELTNGFTNAYNAGDPTTVLTTNAAYKPSTYSYAYVATAKAKLPF